MTAQIEEGHRRLFPALTDSSFLVLRSRRKIFTRWFKQLNGTRLRVLDVGARHQPYRPLLEDRAEHYVALDVRNAELADIVADGQALPFAPGSFDVVIATQVFEYFQSPHLAVQEMHAVLRPGGVLFGSVAAFAPQFISREQWRFFPQGIRSLLGPFSTVEIVPELHDVGSALRNLNVTLGIFLRFRGGRALHHWALCPLLNLSGATLENLNLRSTDALTCSYSLRAVK